eukprot:COSAG06_NODE_17185_length_956_cov_1.318553_2_plen_50_part_01
MIHNPKNTKNGTTLRIVSLDFGPNSNRTMNGLWCSSESGYDNFVDSELQW